MNLRPIAISLASIFPLLCPARDIHVGIDPGVPSIANAIKAAQPGDTIHLEPKVYRDYAGFYAKKGEPGKPITLDGHGATLEGSDPLDPAQWKEVSPGLYAADDLLPRLDDAIIGRWFFLFGGEMQLMNRTSKGHSEPLKKPEDLQPGEWTFVKDPSREKPVSRQIYGTFYLRITPGHSLAQEEIASPVRSAGVQFSGANAHLVIKNLTATHPYNDGFNIHGDCRDCVFENIRAIECGDDGISAHESAQYRVDGFASIGNSTGICDTGSAQTSYNNIFLARNVGFDLYFLDNGRYRITNAVVLSQSQNPFSVTGRQDQRCQLEVDNLLFRRLGPPKPAFIAATASVNARRLTMEGIDFDARGQLQIHPTDGGATKSELLKLVPKPFQSAATMPLPTLRDVPYGPHPRQVIDFYRATAEKPTPLVVHIHGGGWRGGDKATFNEAGKYLAAGISVAAINYRLIADAEAAKITPPVKGPLHDAARALQFIRSKAAEWNIDKDRIGATGSSAGACTSLWLAFHPDLADQTSSDPIARESTRLWCAAVVRPQTTLDPQQMVEWTPNSNYGSHAFGFKGDAAKNITPFAEFLARRAEILPWIAEYSPYALVSADDPPVYLIFKTAPAMGQPQEDPTHTVNFGIGLQSQCQKVSIECEVAYPGAPNAPHAQPWDFLIEKLKTSPHHP